jgi:hypothetical protein
LVLGVMSHAGERRRGEAGNRGCSAHPFGGSRKNAENRGGSPAFTRIGLKTAATAVVSKPHARRRRGRFAPDSGLAHWHEERLSTARGAAIDYR